MKIDSSAIGLSSARLHEETHQREEILRVWVDRAPERRIPDEAPLKLVDVSEISEGGKNMQIQHMHSKKESEESINPENVKLKSLIQMLRALFDKDFKASLPPDLKNPEDAGSQEQPIVSELPPENSNQSARETRPSQGAWHSTTRETHYESEQTTFSAEGVVKTSDGKEIAVDVNLSMSRSFYQQEVVTQEEVQLKDPLVINFNGNAVQVTDTTFSFDLDANGEAEDISFVERGSGFLALDKNNDGIINDGSELFGAKTGDGFAELAAHDEDGNGWIDENDSVFQQLKVWTNDQNGDKQLVGLLDVGAGAIYLQNAATEFSLKNDENRTLAEVASTGIYLRENGGAGTLQQINLVV